MNESTEYMFVLISDIFVQEHLIQKSKSSAENFRSRNASMIKLLNEKYGCSKSEIVNDQICSLFSNYDYAIDSAREAQKIVGVEHYFDVNYKLFKVDKNAFNQDVNSLLKDAPFVEHYRAHRNQIFVEQSILNEMIPENTSGLLPIENEIKYSSSELSMDDELLKKLDNIIEQNINNEHFSVEELADAMAISRSNLHRKLIRIKNQSISQYIRLIRLEKGLDLLQKEVATVSEIAYRVGFGSPAYFVKCFHEHYGFPPGEVKRRNQKTVEFEQRSEEPDENNEIQHISKFEAIHPISSQALIEEVFEEMVKIKPVLEKYLISDDEIDTGIDMRMLAYQLIRNYPWPIGIEIRRLLSASLRNSSLQRLTQLNKAILRIQMINMIILLSEFDHLLERMSPQYLTLPTTELKERLDHLTIPNIIWIFEKICNQLSSVSDQLFIPELYKNLDEAYFRELKDWQYMQSLIVQPDLLKNEDIKENCAVLEETMVFFLKKSVFLINYRLVNVGQINVNKLKFKSPIFKHYFNLLNSTDAEFKVWDEENAAFSDSQSVLLMKSIKETSSFLNLSPFLIDTHHLEEGKPFKIKDIFIYDGQTQNRHLYRSLEANVLEDFNGHDLNKRINEEFDGFFTRKSKS